MAQHVLSLRAVSKNFGAAQVLKGIDLDVADGEFISLLGPSGCGKTTTLNLVAGFHTPDAGDVWIDGKRVNDLPAFRRDLGMVFQGHALFPHMTCFENVAFGLRMRRLSGAEIRERVGAALELVRLSGFESRFPRELSGGQQQRVGLARALAVRPRLLLLDEPLSNLDAKLRRAMQAELRAIHRQVRTTMIYVTHDQEEALTLSDRVAVMNGGQIEQLDDPRTIYRAPRTRFVADFIGASSFIEGTVTGSRDDGFEVTIDDAGTIPVRAPMAPAAGTRVQLAVRSDRMRLVPESVSALGPTLSARVVDTAFAGSIEHVTLHIGAARHLMAHLPAGVIAELPPDTPVRVYVAPEDWMVLA